MNEEDQKDGSSGMNESVIGKGGKDGSTDGTKSILNIGATTKSLFIITKEDAQMLLAVQV